MTGNWSIARTEKGSLMTISKEGMPIFEAQSVPGENPIIMAASDRVILAPTESGSIITYAWPKAWPAAANYDCSKYSTEYKVHQVSSIPPPPPPYEVQSH